MLQDEMNEVPFEEAFEPEEQEKAPSRITKSADFFGKHLRKICRTTRKNRCFYTLD